MTLPTKEECDRVEWRDCDEGGFEYRVARFARAMLPIYEAMALRDPGNNLYDLFEQARAELETKP